MGGLIELRGDTLNLQGNVFKACGQEEAIALLDGRANYVASGGDVSGDDTTSVSIESKCQVTDDLLQ